MKCFLILATAGISLTLSSSALQAQTTDSLTLSDCIRIAGERSLEVQNKRLQHDQAKLQVESRRNTFLPNLSAGLGSSLTFGRSADNMGVSRERSSANASLSIGGNMTLFSGFSRLNDLKASRLQLESAEADIEQTHWSIRQRVTQLYFTLLYARRVEEVASQDTLNYRQQFDYASSMVKTGKWSRDKEAEAHAELSASQLRLIEAQNNVALARIDLLQALELSEERPIASLPIEEEIRTSMSRLRALTDPSAPLLELPSLRANRKLSEAGAYQLKSARGRYLPTLTLSAGYSNGYFHVLTEEFRSANLPFSTQWKQNGSANIGFSLNIPIFDAFSTRTSIRSAKLNLVNLELQRRTLERSRDKEIEQARLNAQLALGKIESSRLSFEANKASQKLLEERWTLGKATMTELSASNQKVLASELEYLNAQYEFVLRIHLLSAYFAP